MDTGGDPISDMEYDSKTAPSTTDANTTTSAYRANTPTPGEYFPDGLNPEEDGELIEHVRHLFGKLVHNNQNVITASDLGPLFSQLDKERKLRLNEPAKDMINSMAQAQGDITITMSQVIDLIPQLRELAPASPASRGGTPGQGRSSIPRPNSMAPSSPMSSRREYGALLPKSGSKKTNTDLWTKQQQQQQANGADYEYFGSEDEGQYRDRRNSTGRRYLARDLLRSPTDNLESPTKSRHSNMFSRHRSDSPNLPSSPLSPGVLARRAKFMSNTMEEPEDYPGDEEMSHADLVNEITNLRREMADYKRRQKESEEHVGTMARQHDEAVAILQQKMDEMQNAISIKKRHILELQGNEKHHREQITLLENEAQKYTKNIKVLRSQLTKMKTQYEEKCADEEKLFAQLRVKDEELQTSESSIEQLATDQRRSAEERLQLERALRRLENDVICAQEFEREHELLQKENQELKRIVKQMKAEHEAWSNRAPVQIPDSLGRASLVTAEAARTGRNLKSEIGNSSFDNDDVLTNNLPKTKTDANNQRHTDNVELLNKVNQYPTESADTSIHEEGHLHRDIYHHIDILRNENEVLQQQKDRIMSDNNRVQEDLRRQLQKANNDKENLILQLEKMRKNGTTGPIIHTQGTQCELLSPSDLNPSNTRPNNGPLNNEMKHAPDGGPQWMVTHAGSDVISRNPSNKSGKQATTLKGHGIDGEKDRKMHAVTDDLRVSELEAPDTMASYMPHNFTKQFRIIQIHQVLLITITIYLFGLLTAPLFFDPTGGKFGVLWRAPLISEPFVGESVWAVQEPLVPARSKWFEGTIYWLESVVFGEDPLTIPT